jgi:RimJ/RimL family protein N-acetyltransferase
MLEEGSSRTPPQLETPRLLLRGWRGRDLKAHAEMSADPEVMRYLGSGRVLNQAEVWSEIAVHLGHWALRGYGQWAVERKEDGASIGRAGLWNPPGWPGLEVGWKLARSAWGQGYATEAGQAAIDWAWATLDADQLISVIQPGNARSIRVAERLGMRRLRETTLKGQDVVIFGIDRQA